MKCSNCNGDMDVSVSIPCPDCIGDGLLEIDALRSLANWVEKNFDKRTRIPRAGAVLLEAVRRAQGRGRFYEKNSNSSRR